MSKFFKKVKLGIPTNPTNSIHNVVNIEVSVYISSSGLFYTTLDKELSDDLIRLGAVLSPNRLGNKGYFEASTLDALITQISNVCKAVYARRMISEETVLLYSIETNCHYSIDGTGEVLPNNVGNFGWRTGTKQGSSLEKFPYGVEVFVKPRLKRVYKYGDGREVTEYDSLGQSWSIKDKEDKPNLIFLMGVCSIQEPYRGTIQEMVYTEDRALFFVNLIKSICMLNERIKSVVEVKELTQLIDSKELRKLL